MALTLARLLAEEHEHCGCIADRRFRSWAIGAAGNCYEPGEFCLEADAGMTGVAGDGNTITCVLESGRYHWHPD